MYALRLLVIVLIITECVGSIKRIIVLFFLWAPLPYILIPPHPTFSSLFPDMAILGLPSAYVVDKKAPIPMAVSFPIYIFAFMSPYKETKGRRLDVMIDKEVVVLLRRLHKAYNKRTGLNVSYARFIEGVATSYLTSDSGKELLQYAIRNDIQ